MAKDNTATAPTADSAPAAVTIEELKAQLAKLEEEKQLAQLEVSELTRIVSEIKASSSVRGDEVRLPGQHVFEVVAIGHPELGSSRHYGYDTADAANAFFRSRGISTTYKYNLKAIQLPDDAPLVEPVGA